MSATVQITSIRKGDGHPHLTFGGAETVCGRTLRENRWAKLAHFDAELTLRLAAATLNRPWSLEAVCHNCMKRIGLPVSSTGRGAEQTLQHSNTSPVSPTRKDPHMKDNQKAVSQ